MVYLPRTTKKVSDNSKRRIKPKPLASLYLPIVRFLYRVYKRFVSPLFGDACRFYPYCSDYALEAIEKHGLIKGGLLAIWRLIRCNPLSEGGFDPVPDPKGAPCRTCHPSQEEKVKAHSEKRGKPLE